MRIFVIFFIVFCIQSKVISEDIKDFEIDGISVEIVYLIILMKMKLIVR